MRAPACACTRIVDGAEAETLGKGPASAEAARLDRLLTFYEFFAGGGMARAGLGAGWRCLFANDVDVRKAAVYRANWGEGGFVCGDVADLRTAQLPERADLVWASFPCQDLSLAGGRRGLGAPGDERPTRSAAFWPFWRLIETLIDEGRGPQLLAIENVPGILTADRGRGFAAIAELLAASGHRFGALVVDACWFLPQSRPRVFIIAVPADNPISPAHLCATPDARWAPPALLAAHARLPGDVARNWVWWALPRPGGAPPPLAAVVEDAGAELQWRAAAETQVLIDMMSPANRAKVEAALGAGGRVVGTLYRRTRPAPDGSRRVRAEVRFDGLAGCLRTPAGGSSRQSVLVVENGAVRSRLLSGREAARLMGLPDSYRLPGAQNEAYHVAGDGVAAPVVAHLARHILEPVLARSRGEPAWAPPDPRALPTCGEALPHSHGTG